MVFDRNCTDCLVMATREARSRRSPTGPGLAPVGSMAHLNNALLPTTILVLLVSYPSSLAPHVVAAGAPLTSAVETAASVLDLTNAERGRVGLSPLRPNPRLVQAAQLHADHMVAVGRLDHVLSGSRYAEPTDRLAAAGYTWQAYAENIAMGQPSAASVVATWMRSSHHRSNILNGTYTELGVGFSVDRQGQPYYVQVFGRPMS